MAKRVLSVVCECGHRFDVPASMRRGLANCPSCGHSTQVSGGAEGLFWLVLGTAIAAVGLLTAAGAHVGGPVFATAVALIGGLGILAYLLAS